jgi:hypothetical protein
MSQNFTLPATLTSAQAIAVAALVSGSTVTEAAEKAGVSRETVSKWVNHSPAFIAEIQNQRAEFTAALRCELMSLGKQAVNVIRETLEKSTGDGGFKDFMAAVKVLELIGAVGDKPTEPTTVHEVSLQIKEKQAELARRKLAAELDSWVGSNNEDDADGELAATDT